MTLIGKTAKRVSYNQHLGLPQLHDAPQRPALITDIRFTTNQIETAQAAGIDTSSWSIDPDLEQDPTVKGSHAFASNWPNPPTYPGTNLRVPYRIKTEDFTDDEYNRITSALHEMSGYLNGCIDFYDDTGEDWIQG